MSATRSKLSIHKNENSGIFEIYTRIRAAESKLAGADGRARKLPGNPRAFLTQLMAELEDGKLVTIFEHNAELTTMGAAKMLSVSRQFLVGLLEQGRIPYHLVGTHRRVYARDVLAFKARRDKRRRRTLDELARAEMNEGLYDRVPLNDSQSR